MSWSRKVWKTVGGVSVKNLPLSLTGRHRTRHGQRTDMHGHVDGAGEREAVEEGRPARTVARHQGPAD
ncbi:hypothetical protein ACFC0C_14555 [Streptomyces sp. NPDC056178]|uniref:hypothetical protein n=1 Tax=unclassified Streptomyces TaxID=2593676 RepID=UPI0035E2329F